MSRNKKSRRSEPVQEVQKALEEQRLLAKLVTGYSSSYYGGQFGTLLRTMFQIPGNVAAKLADPVLLQYEWARSILLDNKRFIVIHSDEQSSLVVDNHDGKLSLIVVDKNKTLAAGLRDKLNRLPQMIDAIDGSLADYLHCRNIILQEMRQWQSVMEIPADIAKYWLYTPTKKLFSHDRKDSYNHLRDERNFWAVLFRQRTVVVARTYYGEQLAVKRENDKFWLQVRLA
jgi:hypothetical protein